MTTTPESITDQQLDELETFAKNIPAGPWTVDDTQAELRGSHGNLLADLWDDRLGAYFTAMHAMALPLVAEVRRLRGELAEEKASHDPRLRCLIVKPARDKDQYVGWSNSCEMPAGVWSRETALEYGFPPSRLDRADETGTSSHIGDGGWDDKGFVAEQRGWLRRELLGDYAVEYLLGDRVAAYALLEPFDDEPAPTTP